MRSAIQLEVLGTLSLLREPTWKVTNGFSATGKNESSRWSARRGSRDLGLFGGYAHYTALPGG